MLLIGYIGCIACFDRGLYVKMSTGNGANEHNTLDATCLVLLCKKSEEQLHQRMLLKGKKGDFAGRNF